MIFRLMRLSLVMLTFTQTMLPGQSKQPALKFWDRVTPSPSTTVPRQIHDAYWRGQFERVNKAVAVADGSQVVFFGDSITLGWSIGKAEGKVGEVPRDQSDPRQLPVSRGRSCLHGFGRSLSECGRHDQAGVIRGWNTSHRQRLCGHGRCACSGDRALDSDGAGQVG